MWSSGFFRFSLLCLLLSNMLCGPVDVSYDIFFIYASNGSHFVNFFQINLCSFIKIPNRCRQEQKCASWENTTSSAESFYLKWSPNY